LGLGLWGINPMPDYDSPHNLRLWAQEQRSLAKEVNG